MEANKSVLLERLDHEKNDSRNESHISQHARELIVQAASCAKNGGTTRNCTATTGAEARIVRHFDTTCGARDRHRFLLQSRLLARPNDSDYVSLAIHTLRLNLYPQLTH